LFSDLTPLGAGPAERAFSLDAASATSFVMTTSDTRKTRRWLRWAILVPLLFLAVPVVWYTQNRMRAKQAAILVTESGAAGGGQQRTPAPETLTLACFNIAHGRGTNDSNWSDRTERDMRLVDMARLIRDQGAHVVVLNEVDFDSAWSGHEDQARIIAEFAGYRHVLEQRNLDVALPFFRLRFGNAILSRYPIEAPRLVEYPPLSSWEHWAAGSKQGVCADIVLAPDTRIRIMAVHLEHRDAAIRERSAEGILKCAQESSLPFFCLGDFNATLQGFPAAGSGKVPGAAADLLLKSGRFKTSPMSEPTQDQLTFPSYAPDRTIDWIMVPSGWQIVTQQVVATRLSDHRLVRMQVRKEPHSGATN
jgi:endonuclease/exonuclease/phosphatase family metal-dependent hydrolase